MRISFGLQYDSYRSDISRAQSKYFEAQQQVSTGKRIQTVSDDPFGATSAIPMRSVRSASNQYASNAQSAKASLSFSESAITEVSTLLKRANELAISGANSTTDQQGRDAMVSELTEIQKRLVDLGNTKGPNEQFLFSGQKTDTQPFTVNGTGLTYQGDSNNLTAEISPNSSMTYNVQLGALLTTTYGQLETLKNDLQGGNTGAISGVDLTNVQGAIKSFDQLRGAIGTSIQTADQAIDHHQRRMDDLTSRISDVEDVDMSSAIIQYKTAETAYQAALQSVNMGNQLSLMDFMR